MVLLVEGVGSLGWRVGLQGGCQQQGLQTSRAGEGLQVKMQGG